MPSIAVAAFSRKAFLSRPSLRHWPHRFTNCGSCSSPSPIKNTSMKSARGSGLYAQGPPATIRGSFSSLSEQSIGIFPRFNILSIFVYDISYCNVNPSISSSLRGVLVSRVKSGISACLIRASISGAGENTLSQAICSSLLRILYKSCSPRYDIPIS